MTIKNKAQIRFFKFFQYPIYNFWNSPFQEFIFNLAEFSWEKKSFLWKQFYP